MSPDTFNQLVEQRIEKIKKTLLKKGQEYAPTKDRLSNFRYGAMLQRVSMAECCRGFMTKHIVSVFDMIQNPAAYTQAQWDEKLGDMINYCILLEAIVNEHPNEGTSS